MRMINKISRRLASVVFALGAGAAYADVVVIVSSKSPIAALTTEQVSNIYLNKRKNSESVPPLVPIDAPGDSHIREDFYRKVTGMSPSQLTSYWSKLIFTSRGYPPREAVNDEAVKRMIAEHSNLIGYVDARFIDPSVKVVLVLK